MFSFLQNFAFGPSGGMSTSALRKMTQRSQFSNYLPYTAYGEDERVYVSTDDSYGFLFECTPLVYAGDKTFSDLSALLAGGFPEDSVLQFILYADPYIDPYLDEYKRFKTSTNPETEYLVESIREFYQEGTKGLDKIQGNVIRNFRLFVALKIPGNKVSNKKELEGFRNTAFESLKGANLHPTYVLPDQLIEFMTRFFNGTMPENHGYDDTIPIRKQILFPETKIKASWNNIKIGDKILRCTTPKNLPVGIDSLLSNVLSGEIWGAKSDSNQIQSPFLLTVNYIMDNLRSKIHTKCNFVLQQKASGSLAPSLIRKQEEYTWAAGECEKGTPFVRVMPILWHIADSEADSSENDARVRRIWENNGFTMQRDVGILKILLLSALPFGLYTNNNNVEFIDRDFIVDSPTAIQFAPIQVDFKGFGKPRDLYIGRKGQIVSLDIFDRAAPNHNVFIAGGTGNGKSLDANYKVENLVSSDTWVRILDLGGSYKKMCALKGGKYIEFSKDSHIVINPFTNIKDIGEDIGMLSAIISQMVYSSTSEKPSETEMSLIKNAIRKTYEEHGNDGEIDYVYQCLKTWKDEDGNTKFDDIAKELAFNLYDFTSSGPFGKWFSGKSNLNIDEDKFVVLELGELKNQVELFKVVTLQLINNITDNLYRSSRDNKKAVILEEVAQFLSKNADSDGSLIAAVTEAGYRRARKHHGSFWTILQSVLDLESFGPVGQVILENTAFKFMLASPSFENAVKRGLLNYPPFVVKLLNSITTQKPRYSEIFVDTPAGCGVVRHVVDNVLYAATTSDANDEKKINKLLDDGHTYEEIFRMAKSNPL